MKAGHLYVYSPNQIAAFFPAQIFQEVISSPAFCRLKSIKFLGAIDYLWPAESRYSRYDHSLAVASLADRYCDGNSLKGKDRTYCIVAGLLHDIGHAPLSHSLEPVFKSEFDIDHHISSERILRGEVPLGVRLSKILESHNLNNIRIMSIIAGHDELKFNSAFSRSINIDTIEAILRCNTYMYKDCRDLDPFKVVDALAQLGWRAEGVLDAFWELKDRVYRTLIQSTIGIAADFICKRYMEKNADLFNESAYYTTEADLRENHARLFKSLEVLGRNRTVPSDLAEGVEVSCVMRRFVIDASQRLTRDSWSLNRRYRQQKNKMVVKIRREGEKNESADTTKYQGSFDIF